MTTGQILLAVITMLIIPLAVSEFSEVCPWTADKLVRWSAHRRYVPPAYAELRAEELAAYIDDRPGKLFKLLTALGFVIKTFLTRPVGPAAAPPEPLWQPTTLTVPVYYEDDESRDDKHPKILVMHQAWYQLTGEVLDAAKEVGVGSRSWRHCIKELRRITGDDRWILVERNLDLLGKINNSPTISTVRIGGIGSHKYIVGPCRWSSLTGSTITHYQVAVETARVEIRRLTSDFMLCSAPR